MRKSRHIKMEKGGLTVFFLLLEYIKDILAVSLLPCLILKNTTTLLPFAQYKTAKTDSDKLFKNEKKELSTKYDKKQRN